MNFKRRFLALSLSTVLGAGLFTGGTQVSANNDEITRGDFANAIVQQLQLTSKNQTVVLPTDMNQNSPYANSVLILKERSVIVGYPDGTFQPNQSITKQEALIMLSKTLGIPLEQAEKVFRDEYGLTFNNATISTEEATNAIQQALRSDAAAHQLMNESAVVQQEQTSFRSDLTQEMLLTLKESIPELNNQNAMSMTADTKMAFHVEDGVHITMTMDLGQIEGVDLPEELSSMQIEQYITPEGMFMQIQNPETGEVEWIKMDESMMPFTFDQLMEMQKESVNANQALLDNKNVFYRDLGTETVDGNAIRKIGYRTTFTSFQELMGIVGQSLPDEMGAQLTEELANAPGIDQFGNLSLAGVIWIDESSKLPTKMSQEISMDMGNIGDSEMPIDRLTVKQKGTFYDYNGVDEIVLPEEAKNAKTFEEMLTIEEETLDALDEAFEEEAVEEIEEEAVEEETVDEIDEEIDEETDEDTLDKDEEETKSEE